jgi:hypothetical protein
VIRHQIAVLVRTRAALAPAAAYLFVLLGVYAYRGSGVGSTYAFTDCSCVLSWRGSRRRPPSPSR